MIRDPEEVPDKNINEEFDIVNLDGEVVSLVTKPSLFNKCLDCYFFDEKTSTTHCEDKNYHLGYCSEHNRKDKQNVKFIRISDIPKIYKAIRDHGKRKTTVEDAHLSEEYLFDAESLLYINEDAEDINENMNLKTLFATALLASSPLIEPEAKEAVTAKVLNAIAEVESNKKNGLKIKDVNGKFSYGMFQIQQPYLDDANAALNTNYTVDDVRYKPDIAKKVVTGYLNKYIKQYKKDNKKAPPLKHIIAMHNGGPKGYKNSNALNYADKVISKITGLFKSSKSKEKAKTKIKSKEKK